MTEPAGAGAIRTHHRLLGTTFPFVRAVLVRHWPLLVGLIALSVIVGILPNLKAQIEAAMVQEITDILEGDRGAEVNLSRPLERMQTSGTDLASQVAAALIPAINVWGAMAFYALFAIAALLAEVLSTALQSRIGRDIFAVLRSEGLKRALLTDPGDLPQMSNVAGQYATAVHLGTATVTSTYSYLLDGGRYLFALGTAVLMIGSKSPLFAAVALVLVFSQSIVSVFQAKRLRERRKDLETRRNDLVARTDDIISKRDLIVAYEQQDRYTARLEGQTSAFADVDRSLDVWERWYGGLSLTLANFGRLAMLGAAVLVSAAGGGLNNVGDVVFITSMYAALLGPASSLLSRYDSIRRSEGTARTFLDLLTTRTVPLLSNREDGTSKPWMAARPITFEAVEFGYDRGSSVLKHCSFTLPACRTTLIVGPSGSGKTTIARLLLKFWTVRGGHISLGGDDITRFSPHEVRAHMSYVAQDDFIVEDLVAENLRWAYSAGELTDEKMRQIADAVGLEPPEPYTDILEVPAKKLSGGGKQRLSLARMMLDESEIMIIDEPLAGSDVFTVGALLPHFKRALAGRTVVLISHRLSFAALADHVIVLDHQGRVIEEGAPATLRVANGAFARLYAAAVSELEGGWAQV